MALIGTCPQGNNNMGGQFGLGSSNTCFKRKFRWMFGLIDIPNSATNIIPPLRGGRPSLEFKEQAIEHLYETISSPVKPSWRPIELTFYDLGGNTPSVPMQWLRNIYNITGGNTGGRNATFHSVLNNTGVGITPFKQNAKLELYDGCGNVMEEWRIENAYPQTIDFGDLDMGSSEIVTISVTLKYDRAVQTIP